jgi:hypothetical protein
LYAAPEVFKPSGKRPAADMYSLGRSLLEIGWGIDLRRLPRTPVAMSPTQLKAWLTGASVNVERSTELLELTAAVSIVSVVILPVIRNTWLLLCTAVITGC